MIRGFLIAAAIGTICLGLWLISSAFTQTAPTSAAAPQVLTAPRQTASPFALGTAMLAGGVILFVLVLRRK